MITGHKSIDKDNVNKAEAATVNPIQHKRMGADSLSWTSGYEVSSGTTASGSTAQTIAITGIESSARAGDFLLISGRVLSVISVSTNTLLIGQFLAPSQIPSSGVSYSLRRYLPPLLNSNGETITTPAAGSVGDVNIAEVGGAAVTDSVPISLKTPHDGMPLLVILGDTFVDTGCTTTVINIVGSTVALKAGDWIFFDSLGALALRQVTRKIASINSATQFTLETALPATPSAGVDRLRVYRPYLVPTSNGVPSISIAESISLAVTNGGLTELAAAIGGIESSTPQISSGIQLAGDNPYAFDGPKTAAPYVIAQAPAGTEYGLVVRNIPSGTQAISAASLPLPTDAATETTLDAINDKLVAGTTIGDVRIRDGAGNALVSTTSAPDTTDRGLITKAVCHASDGGVGTTTPLVALADTPNLFDTGLVTRSIVYNTDGFAVAPASADANGRFNINSRTQDGSGNSIVSATATPGSSVRGLVTRSFAYLNDGNGVKLTAETDEFAYNAAGLGVRDVADVFVNNSQPGELVAPHGYYLVATRTTTTGSTTTVINTTVDPSLVCRRGDKIRIASGTFAEGIYQESVVSSVSTTAITLQFPLTVAPPTSRTIYILRPLSFAVDASGQQYSLVTPLAPFPTYPVYANKFFSEGGSLAFGSISSSYATIYTTSTQTAILVVSNLTNVNLTFSFDSGSTDALSLAPNDSFTLAAIQNGGYIDGVTDIQVKDEGVAAASGFVRATGYYF